MVRAVSAVPDVADRAIFGGIVAADDSCPDRVAPVVVDLDADDLLFGLEHDATLRALDAAHEELDRREATVRRAAKGSGRDRAAAEVDGEPVRTVWEEQLDAICTLRDVVVAEFRREVQEYAQSLRVAIELRVGALPFVGVVQVNVSASVSGDYVRTPSASAAADRCEAVEQAVAEAISQTPTPGHLPGTLLRRAESAAANSDGVIGPANCL